MVSGPADASPVVAMWVTAKPSGTSSRSGSSSRSSVQRHVRRGRARIASALKAQPHPADADLVAVGQRHWPVDAVAVDVGAVGAALVLHEPAPPAKGEHGVVGTDEVVLDVDGVVDVATDGADRAERDAAPHRRLPLRRVEDCEATDARLAGLVRQLRAAEVAEQRSREGEEQQVEQRQEADLQDEEQDAQDLARHPRTWNSISVDPIRMRSPGPSATSLTGWPLTSEPLRLPRSAKPEAP